MNARPFGWQDLIPLIRYGEQVLSLDAVLRLTRGNPAGLGGLITLLHPAVGSYTAVIPAEEKRTAAIGQVVRQGTEFGAHLSFIMPENSIHEDTLFALLDMLTCQAGEMGAGALALELEEEHAMFNAFRQAGFGIYAWQHMWKMPDLKAEGDEDANPWQECVSKDRFAIKKLYASVVPPLVQSVEPVPYEGSSCWLIKQDGGASAFASASFGTHGIVLRLILHPESENNAALIPWLLQEFSTLGRPVYIMERLYQAHLGNTLRELGGMPSPLYALMAKLLMTRVREGIAERVRRVVNGRQPEPTAPMSTCRK